MIPKSNGRVESVAHALIVDDDVDAAMSLKLLVAHERLTVAVAATLHEARRQIALQQPDLILLDLELPDGSGMALFEDEQLVANSEIVLITGHASVETSVQALRLGAADYLVKPINMRRLQGLLSRLMKPSALQAEVADLADQLATTGHFGPLWGRSAAMQRVHEQITRVAGTGITVLISGESGTGKELVAQTLHTLSRRRKQPFLAVNCGAISPHLIESEIFGHEKGSFTGAERQHLGFFERATGGTLFLDEVTEMSAELQVKLLRVLETGRFMRVGSTQSLEADVRIVAATNREPLQAVAEGKLREDLMYRLNVFPIVVPPLRERLEDVPLLAAYFLQALALQEGHNKRFDAEALHRLGTYRWPGNVRELYNAVQRAYVMTASAVIDMQWLPIGPTVTPLLSADQPTAALPAKAPVAADATVTLPIGATMAQMERTMILATMAHCQNHRERAAAILGISLKTLYNRLKDYAAHDASGNETH
jgi:DNA-binding NtrC family response regulator